MDPKAQMTWREKLAFYEEELAKTDQLGRKCKLWIGILGIRLLLFWPIVLLVVLFVAWQRGRGWSPEQPVTTQPAAVPSATEGERERTPYDSVPVTIRAKERPLRQVLLDCAHQAELTLGVQPVPDRRVTLELEEAPLASVLDDLCKSYSCTWRIIQKPAPVLLVTFPE